MLEKRKMKWNSVARPQGSHQAVGEGKNKAAFVTSLKEMSSDVDKCYFMCR